MMRGAESLSVPSAMSADTAHSVSAPFVSSLAASKNIISSRVILSISIVVSIFSGLLLLMRPAAHAVESVAGLTLTDIA
jgi:hypothetical protein